MSLSVSCSLLILATPDGVVRVLSMCIYNATVSVDVFLTADALPPLFACESIEAFITKVRAGKELDFLRNRFNARGVLRLEEGTQASSQPSLSQGVGQSNLKRYISAVELTPTAAAVSPKAVSALVGLNPVSTDLVLPIPVGRLTNHHVLGMRVVGWDQVLPVQPTLSLHRALFLVEGTTKTTLKPLRSQDGTPETTSCQATCTNIRCLL